MQSCVIEILGASRQFVGPFADEKVARDWFAEHGNDAVAEFHTVCSPDPPAPGLATIPRRIRLRPESPRFIRVEELHDEWLIIGRAEDLPEKREVRVYRFHQQDYAPVVVNRHIAERVVAHRDNDATTFTEVRYVLATTMPVK